MAIRVSTEPAVSKVRVGKVGPVSKVRAVSKVAPLAHVTEASPLGSMPFVAGEPDKAAESKRKAAEYMRGYRAGIRKRAISATPTVAG